MLIPRICFPTITNMDLDALMRIGFCYVKLPNENLTAKIKTANQIARNFFQKDTIEKEKYKIKAILNEGDRYQGYALRTQSQNTNCIEQIFFEPDAPFGPYAFYTSLIQDINHTFMKLIFIPLMREIFNKLQLSETIFNEVTENPYRSLVFQSYPSIREYKDVIRLNAHKDFGLLTVLYFEESGLEVHYQNTWESIPAQKDCVVVNLGNALELMTGKQCHSALHRVKNATEDRVSMVYFINPNSRQPVRNYIDNSIIASTGEKFFKQQFKEYYEVNH